MHLLHVIHSVDRRHGGLAEGLRQLVAAGASLGQRHEVATLDAPGTACLADFPVPLHALGAWCRGSRAMHHASTQ
jgi:hypothetical protein